MRFYFVLAAIAIAGLGIVWAGGQERAGNQASANNNDEAGLRATMTSYAAALKSGDLSAIMNFWAADADFTAFTSAPAEVSSMLTALLLPELSSTSRTLAPASR